VIQVNYSKDIEKCIKFIENNIKEIADYVGYSVNHFCRVFVLCKGVSIMEYLRKRKLSLAAMELFKGKKIIDIAFEYGFETPSGFSKAFRKAFGYSPTQYVARMDGYFNKETTFKIGGYIMNPIIVGTSYTKDIASFWSNYDGENLESKMYEILNPPKHGEVGLCVPTDEGGNVSYLLGVIVEDFSKVTEDMITVEVPEAEYAVFTTPPVDVTVDPQQLEFSDVIKETWRYIFEEWFKDSGYIYDEGKLDFEFYDERCHYRPDTVMEIYVPVKKLFQN
jgi:AraC family transcriptional regulator